MNEPTESEYCETCGNLVVPRFGVRRDSVTGRAWCPTHKQEFLDAIQRERNREVVEYAK